jgi:predicted P-loop ATPase
MSAAVIEIPVTASPADWRSALAKRSDRYVGDERNVLLALRAAPELQCLVRYNEFQNRVELARCPPWRAAETGALWTDNDDLDLKAWLQDRDIDVRQSGIVGGCIERAARDVMHHPVREYLRALTWDGTLRLDAWLANYLSAVAPRDYLAAVGPKALIAAVARVMRPGCQVDNALVLEDPKQGTGKTSTIRILGWPWTTDAVHDLAGADAAIQLAGVWFVELSELAAMRRSDLESMKAFLSRMSDRYRPPYGKRAVDVPRQCIFVGTTNESQYLRDPTGNRRFWPVRTGVIDLAALERDRDQLFAEAVMRFDADERWHLARDDIGLAEAEQGSRLIVTEIEQVVTGYLQDLTEAGRREVTTIDVMRDCFDIDPREDIERAGRIGAQLSHILNRCGWTKVATVGRTPNRRTVYRFADDTRRGSQG